MNAQQRNINILSSLAAILLTIVTVFIGTVPTDRLMASVLAQPNSEPTPIENNEILDGCEEFERNNTSFEHKVTEDSGLEENCNQRNRP